MQHTVCWQRNFASWSIVTRNAPQKGVSGGAALRRGHSRPRQRYSREPTSGVRFASDADDPRHFVLLAWHTICLKASGSATAAPILQPGRYRIFSGYITSPANTLEENALLLVIHWSGMRAWARCGRSMDESWWILLIEFVEYILYMRSMYCLSMHVMGQQEHADLQGMCRFESHSSRGSHIITWSDSASVWMGWNAYAFRAQGLQLNVRP